jgi:uncharacterized protein (TIRG00374 family)
MPQNMSKLKIATLVSIPLGLLAIALIIYYVGPGEIYSEFASASIFFLLCYIAVSFLLMVLMTFKWQLILHAEGIKVRFWRLFAYRVAGYGIGFVTPSAQLAGDPVRAYLLKRDGADINAAFSAVIIDRTTDALADALFFIIGGIAVLASVGLDRTVKLILFGFAFLILAVAGIFIIGILQPTSIMVRIFRFLQLHRIRSIAKVQENLAQIEERMARFYRTKKDYVIAMLLVVIVFWFLMFLEYKFALLIFGINASVAQVFLIMVGVVIAYTLPVPAALGTLELSQLSAAQVFDMSNASAVALAFLVRLRDIIWAAWGLVFLSAYQISILGSDADEESRGDPIKSTSKSTK